MTNYDANNFRPIPIDANKIRNFPIDTTKLPLTDIDGHSFIAYGGNIGPYAFFIENNNPSAKLGISIGENSLPNSVKNRQQGF